MHPNAERLELHGNRLAGRSRTGLHARVLARIQPDRHEEDVFPTVYRCNSVRRLRARVSTGTRWKGVVIAHESEPAYLSFSRTLYALAGFHQRHAPRALRRTLLAFGRKPLIDSLESPAASSVAVEGGGSATLNRGQAASSASSSHFGFRPRQLGTSAGGTAYVNNSSIDQR